MFRSLIASIVLALGMPAATTSARLFLQTYGATQTAPDGAGCVWNPGQDYFVPRYCRSARYGLFSPCKTSCLTSAACWSLDPWRRGYCCPFEKCRYERRDHVYRTHCGCQPWACYCGPWRLENCPRPCCVLRHGAAGCHAAGGGCRPEAYGPPCLEGGRPGWAHGDPTSGFAYVEPLSGDSLGKFKVNWGLGGMGMGGAGGMAAPGMGMGGMGMGGMPAAGAPPAAGGGGLGGLFGGGGSSSAR